MEAKTRTLILRFPGDMLLRTGRVAENYNEIVVATTDKKLRKNMNMNPTLVALDTGERLVRLLVRADDLWCGVWETRHLLHQTFVSPDMVVKGGKLGKVVRQHAPECPYLQCTNGGANQWTTKTGVEQSSAQTREACREICRTIPGCDKMYYNANGRSVKCWTFFKIENPQLLPKSSVVLETIKRCVISATTPCTNGGTNQWTTTTNVHVINGVEQSSAQTLDACRQKCLTISGCNAI
ncbi:hypothetical protein LSH36_2410g00009, partial [Paralvinella palmiformis]